MSLVGVRVGDVYTLAEWDRRKAERALYEALRDLPTYGAQRLTDDEIREATATLRALAAKLRGEEKSK